jgi:uncharacterized protein (UPF0212 family)
MPAMVPMEAAVLVMQVEAVAEAVETSASEHFPTQVVASFRH